MRETYGVPVEEIVRGIKHGVRKVNIDTDLRLAGAAEFRRVAKKNRAEFDPRKFLKPAIDAMSKRLPRPLRGLRLRRPGRAYQGQADERNGQALRQRRARSACGDRKAAA